MMANAARRARNRGHKAPSSNNSSIQKKKKEKKSENSKKKGDSMDSSGSNNNNKNNKRSRKWKRTYYIVKPVGGCQGKNIFLTTDWKRVSRAQQVHFLFIFSTKSTQTVLTYDNMLMHTWCHEISR